jgi:hypothetical protein
VATTVSEVFETIYRFVGAERGQAAFAGLAAGASALTAAETAATASTRALTGALASLGGPLATLSAGLGTLAGLGAVGASLTEFADSQQNLFRTTILFQNLGTSLPINELQELSAEIQALTGFDDDLIISLGGVLARFNIAGDQIPEATRAIADAAAATGQTIDELGLTFGRALLGNTRGLRTLGIEFKATGDRAADAARLVELFNERFEGAGEGRRQLLAGTFDALQNSLANLFEAIGRILAPAAIGFFNNLIRLMDLVTQMLTDLANRFPTLFASGATIAQQLNIKGDPEQTRLLGQIEENTRGDSRLVQQVLGGPGNIATRAATLRDARIAFGV